MPVFPVPIIKGDSIGGLETDYRDALPVNMYAVQRKILNANGYMLDYPGLSSYATGSGVDRGGIYNERLGYQYRVSGNSLIRVNAFGVVNSLGTVTGSDQAAMPYSFNTQAVVANGNMYLYDPTNGFREVTDPDLGSPIDCVWVDGYYFLTDGEYIYHTDITDEESIDPLKFATAEFMPDPSLGLAKTQDNKVLVFGRYTLEYFVNAESSNFAFQRVATRAQKIGIVATHAKCEHGTNFYITGGRKDDGIFVYKVGLGDSKKVSTREVDKVLSQYTEPDLVDMRMESRKDDNISFILIHLPNEVLCFNETIYSTLGAEYAWAILKSDVYGDTPYRGINSIFDAKAGSWICGDKQDSTIGRIDDDVSTHYGENVESIFYSPFMKLERMSISKVELETIPGNTTTDDATVAFSVTEDGKTYGKEYWLDYGSPNDYGQRFIIRRVGYVRDWMGFKFRSVSSSRMSFANMRVEAR